MRVEEEEGKVSADELTCPQIVYIFIRFGDKSKKEILCHLPELGGNAWYDIMKLAAYRQYNPKIPTSMEFRKM